MLSLLIRLFVKDKDNVADPNVREAYGTLAGIVGVALNVILFISKYIAGILSGSVAIAADAFNNLSDAGSSLITLFGFKLAGKRPHSDHPFGHGRWEYIAGLIVSLAIIMMGFSLAKDSVSKIISPVDTEFNYIAIIILISSILIKLYMACYNSSISKKISSVATKATAIDSLSDACATTIVLVSIIVSKFTGLRIDGYAGAVVSLMILWGGFNAARDTISPLLGKAPDPEFVKRIYSIVNSYEIVTGVHDLVIHDYGVGRRMISLHAEVPSDGDILATHDAIDLIERQLSKDLNCHAVIHMDPIATNDELVNKTKIKVLSALRREMGDDITIHDFRMVSGPTHTNVIFDVVLPPESNDKMEEIKTKVTNIVSKLDGNYNAIVTVDIAMVM